MCQFMQEALQLAQRGKYTVAPNPLVGCVIVREEKIVGRGWHHYAGGPHAEIFALQEAGKNARGATAYITLEPCSHHGKTPPCVTALIDAGIKEVHFPFLDPNPNVNGQGLALLQAHGITVKVGECATCAAEAKKINTIFLRSLQLQRPYITLKWAMSADGQLITPAQQSRHISGESAQQHSHQLRQIADAILVGSETARQDDPQLTTRHQTFFSSEFIKHPLRIILNSKGDLPADLKLFNADLPGKTLIVSSEQASKSWIEDLSKKQIEVWQLPVEDNQSIDLSVLLNKLYQQDIRHLLVEGGAKTHRSFIDKKLVDELWIYLAPQLIGQQLDERLLFAWDNIEKLDQDLFLMGKIKEEAY